MVGITRLTGRLAAVEAVRFAAALALVVSTAAACGSDGKKTLEVPDSPGEPDRNVVGTPDTPGTPDKPAATEPPGSPDAPDGKAALLAVHEAEIATSYTEGGAVVRVPLTADFAAGTAGELTVTVTPLLDSEGTSGSASFDAAAGETEVEVAVPGLEPLSPAWQSAGYLVRYSAKAGGLEASGTRSLFETLSFLGLQVWAPLEVDAGATTTVRVFARNLRTSALVPGVSVTLAGQSGTTDAAGQIAFDVAAPADGSSTWTLSAEGEHEGSTATHDVYVEVVPPGSPKVLVTTDKPIYRPGQTIHVRVLALGAGDQKPLAATPVTIQVRDGKDNKVFQAETETDAYGIASLEAPLAPQVNVGDYEVLATAGGVGVARVVEVTEEKLPKFEVTLLVDEPWFAPGEDVTGVVKARYFFGQPVAGAAVSVMSGLGTFQGTTDAEGLAAFTLPGGAAGSISLRVDVVDTAGFAVHKDGKATIAAPALSVELVPEAPTVPYDAPWTLFVRTRGPTGAPLPATCTPEDGEPFETGKDGWGAAEVTGNLAKVSCKSADGTTGKASKYVSNAESDELVRIAIDRVLYEPGEPVDVTVIAPGAPGIVWLDVARRGAVFESVEVLLDETGTGTATLSPAAGDTGLLVLTAWFLDGATAKSGTRAVYARKPLAKVEVSTSKESYLPGTEAKLTFSVTDEAGKGQAAAIGVAIADEAVFALAGATSPSDVASHFLLGDVPAAIHGVALSEATDSAQLAAAAALAGEPLSLPSGATGSSFEDVVWNARTAWTPALNQVADELRVSLQTAASEGVLTVANAEELLSELAWFDFWGQGMTVDVYAYEWGNGQGEASISLSSKGPDEVSGTSDDWYWSTWIWLPGAKSSRNGGGPAGAPSAGGAFGDDESGDWAGEADAAAAEPEPSWSDASEPESDAAGEEEKGPEKRDDFPETLYVNPAVITDGAGKAEVTLPLADNITEWRVSMVANTKGGLVGGGQGGITVFQPFFVDVDLPVSLTQGDRLALPVGVFNFSDAALEVTVTLAEASWFALEGPAEVTVEVAAGKSLAVPFDVEVKQAGTHALEVTAVGGEVGDAVVRTVEVVPDGQVWNDSVSGPLDADREVVLPIPANAIAGGSDAFVKILGAPAAQVLDGMEALLQAPNGCFEPMMNATWVNALVLDYLVATGDANETLEATAQANLSSGLQQCLTFECTGGGFTWFGNPDPPHPILSAFALIMFHDIAEHRDMDDEMVARARKFLEGKQSGAGSWTTEEGTKNQLLPWDELRTTCIVAWGLAANGKATPAALAKANSFIQEHLDLEADTYTLAMCANALLAASPDDPSTDAVVAEILDRAVEEDGLVAWDSDHPGITYAYGDVIAVETTALVAQALYATPNPPLLVEGAMKFLASRKSPDGNFGSTQGTIQSLRAFVQAAKVGSGDTDATVTVKVGGKTAGTVHVDASNKDVVHFVSLSEHLTGAAGETATLAYSGKGKLAFQLASRWYVPWEPDERREGPMMDVSLTYEPKTLATDGVTTATLTVTGNGVAASPGDMPMVLFPIPPGFDADFAPIDFLVQDSENVARYEKKPDHVLFYLHHVPATEEDVFTLAVPLRPRFAMEVTTPVAKAWSFYEPEDVSESLPEALVVTEAAP